MMHTGPEHDELNALRKENARLIALLESNGIEWRPAGQIPESATSQLSPEDKIAIFRRLFRGRTDVYPVRWESQSTGKSGYSPACANEWHPGICAKPRIKCSDCSNRQLIPVSDTIIYRHLTGKQTVGVYPLMEGDTCYFLAVDFDEAEWRDDAKAFMQSCEELGIPAVLEISRSGQGAHIWVFFSDRVPARDARRLGTTIISHTCAKTRQLQLNSYDRLFPNQDVMPKGGFGNLIVLPLQKEPREKNRSVFVDTQFQPYVDQWTFLSTIKTLPVGDVEPTILRASGGAHPLDITFIDDEDLATPWRQSHPSPKLLAPMPESLNITLANLIYFEKAQLPQTLANRLIRLAAFQNPEFYKTQAMRMSVWNKPRVIGCAENFPLHIALPRGCFEAALSLLRDNNVAYQLKDERFPGEAVAVEFSGTLRADQEAAIDDVLRHDTGVLCAPTAFGKTVVAAAIIARRSVNTLILVHRSELLKQWQERLSVFLNTDCNPGVIGGGKRKPGGKIDIAVMQSLSRQGEVDPLIDSYGHIIVDECHHVGASSFDAILRRTKARYVLGLTATPIRRDGQQPIIFMQCGPIRHTASKPVGSPQNLEVFPHSRFSAITLPIGAGVQDIFRHIAQDQERTSAIARETKIAYEQGHKVLVLTERTDHLTAIVESLGDLASVAFVLHGRLSKKQRSLLMANLNAIPSDAPRILLATGKLVGEGFDHPPLDTLILAMPVSWKGTLQQYAGRLHREQAGKTNVRIIDFVDTGHPVLLRMWDKRQRGYQAMGYRIVKETEELFVE
ncbi:DEAD/DEAH box helicase family protein [Salmonella enterica]|nr:DEAD/DEAH box helicase family protein [Salmonella enterica]EKT1626111.1 DEAD/DEAH box helicase family protein [Salmonella enterica]